MKHLIWDNHSANYVLQTLEQLHLLPENHRSPKTQVRCAHETELPGN